MRISFLLLCIMMVIKPAFSQDDLLRELEQQSQEVKQYTIATFKGTRVANGHSVEIKKEGELEFLIEHRFGRLNTGVYNFWGLDEAFIRLGFEYGIRDWLGIGIGRNSFNKIYDGYLKFKLLRQSSGSNSFPFSITGLLSANIQTYPNKEIDPNIKFFDRASYAYQLLIARKFSPKFSAQVSPTLVHSNRLDQDILNNDQYAVGISGRYKATRSFALNVEYYYRIKPNSNSPYHNSLAFNFELETGGHVFQLIFSNTQGMIEQTFLTRTEGNFLKGDIHYGFNISRTFQIKKTK